MQWRPIETAPKDNGSKLVWCPEWKNTYTAVWGFDRDTGAMGWRHFGSYAPLNEQPSHWMPLPKPPTA